VSALEARLKAEQEYEKFRLIQNRNYLSDFDGQRYLIPGLLPKERPDFEWPDAGTIALEYRYAILPAAVIWRLMVRLHYHIWTGSDGRVVHWRNGLVLARDGCRALLNLEARRIFTHYDPASDMEIDVRALLDGIETEAERDVRVLANNLREQFSRGDLRQLAFDLGVDHEDLPGDTKTDLARELTLDCQRRGRLAELERVVERERP
jgi:hypothetical protein